MINFGSDNEAPMREEILNAIARSNNDFVMSYGEDNLTKSLSRRFSTLFEKEVSIFPVSSGTAANSLSIAQLTPPYGAVFCHEHSHLYLHETGAPEFFSGAKLIPIKGHHGKISPKALTKSLNFTSDHGYHSSMPTVLSITQPTEYGTVYSLNELKELSEIAHKYNLKIHMDGARFANAIAHLKCTPAECTWKLGVDILSFGSTKNGTLNGEGLVIFDHKYTLGMKWRLKQTAQLTSKARFISTQLKTYIEKNNWITWASEVNLLAKALESRIKIQKNIETLFPVEANILIVRMTDQLADHLRNSGFNFYPWREHKSCYRLVLSNINTKRDIFLFTEALIQANDLHQ